MQGGEGGQDIEKCFSAIENKTLPSYIMADNFYRGGCIEPIFMSGIFSHPLADYSFVSACIFSVYLSL